MNCITKPKKAEKTMFNSKKNKFKKGDKVWVKNKGTGKEIPGVITYATTNPLTGYNAVYINKLSPEKSVSNKYLRKRN